MSPVEFKNPYRPGAGHMPPHLAGREREYEEFDRLLEQDDILENMVLTGLRGVGKQFSSRPSSHEPCSTAAMGNS